LIHAIEVATAQPYVVYVGAGALVRAHEKLADELERGVAALISDDRVWELWGAEQFDTAPFLLPRGEAAKCWSELGRLLESLAERRFERSACLYALGGGAVGDAAGLAASLYLRGVDFVQCPTTLLSQADASVGGKTAVNLAIGKNLVGAFHQPLAVYADTRCLSTLTRDELRSGLGEVLKTALVAGEELLALVEERAELLLAGQDADAIAEVVAPCVETKARIVASDEREAGTRQLLNLGHTFGHAIEQAAGPGRVPHGVAVALGIVLALRASAELGLLRDPSLPQRISALLLRLELPGTIRQLESEYGLPLTPEAMILAMGSDKKARGGRPTFVLPRAAGELVLGQAIEADLLTALLSNDAE